MNKGTTSSSRLICATTPNNAERRQGGARISPRTPRRLPGQRSTLPGFSRLCGSSARLSVFINSISIGDL
ncbi:MAG: hypothetical protein VB143_09530 [Burkholderia sp.]